MKIGRAIEHVERAERELAPTLRSVGERHALERDLYHLGRTLATRGAQRVDLLAEAAARYGASRQATPSAPEPFREEGGAGSPLLDDLCELSLRAHDAELAWTILLQAARAARDGELAGLAESCREEVDTVCKWARTRVKETAPQALATGRRPPDRAD